MAQGEPVQLFTKMHGAGNDFVVFDNRQDDFSPGELCKLAPIWCDRKRGIGADGILALQTPENDKHDLRMIYLNADGSRATMCGNGGRCIARFARSLGIDSEPMQMETDAGIYRASVPMQNEENVRLFVPAPRHLRLNDMSEDGQQLHYVWTGTHHVVTLVEDLSSADVDAVGARWRHHERYQPEGTNVNFVQVVGADNIQVRTFEKGVEAETEACGTGAIASAVVCQKLNRIQGEVAYVSTHGGVLKVGLVEPYFLEGPAEISFRGEIATT